MIYRRSLYITGFIVGLISTVITFFIFKTNIENLGTPNEWTYYAALAGFLIFLTMFTTLVITLIVKFLIKK